MCHIMKVVFMGTPEFAVGALEAIVLAGHQVAAVVTQPDKPKGRGKEVQMTPVKQCALKYDIPVFQPVKIRETEAVEELRRLEADIFIVAAFGQLLPKEILTMPKLGCINIHASLLPKYRGAAPIQWVIMNGEKETGITIMQMDIGLDTGDMLMKRVVCIDEKETGESLHDKLREAGAKLIVEILPKLEAGEIIPQSQREEEASYVTVLKKSLGHINWTKEAAVIERLVRGLNSWPSAYTTYENKTLKIWESSSVDGADEESIAAVCGGEAVEWKAGSIVMVLKDAFYVATGEGLLKVTEVQLEGKRRMKVKDFLLGCPLKRGMLLGE